MNTIIRDLEKKIVKGHRYCTRNFRFENLLDRLEELDRMKQAVRILKGDNK